MSDANDVCKKVGKKLFKAVLKKVLPVPGAGLAVEGVTLLDKALDQHDQDRLAKVRRLEKQMGSHSPDDIGSVRAALEDCVGASGPLSQEAVHLASDYNVCTWRAPNGLWVFHKNPKYRPCYRLPGAKIYRPNGVRLKDGSQQVVEVAQ